MTKTNEPQLQEWMSALFKGLVVVIFSMFTFFVNQLNGNIGSLTIQLKAMETHQIETDKRVLAIEVSREVNMEAYKKVVSDVGKQASDVQDIKTQLSTLSLRVQTIADFVARRAK